LWFRWASSAINLPPASAANTNLQKAIEDVNQGDDVVYDPFCHAVQVFFLDSLYGGPTQKLRAKRNLGIACRNHLISLLGLGPASGVDGQSGAITSFDFNSGHHSFLVDNLHPGRSFYGYCPQTQKHVKSNRDPTWILQYVCCE